MINDATRSLNLKTAYLAVSWDVLDRQLGWESSNKEGRAVLRRSNAGQDAGQCDEQRHQRQAPDKDAEIAEVYPLCHFQERAYG